jgi:hypothetical protein
LWSFFQPRIRLVGFGCNEATLESLGKLMARSGWEASASTRSPGNLNEEARSDPEFLASPAIRCAGR